MLTTINTDYTIESLHQIYGGHRTKKGKTMTTQNTPTNPLIGDLPADTLNNIGAVLALLEVMADTITTQALTNDAAAGLTLILGLVGDAVKAVRVGLVQPVLN